MKKHQKTLTLTNIIFNILIYATSVITATNYGYWNTDIFSPLIPLKSASGPITREYNLKLSRVELAPDGFTRTVWASNGQYPGPIIRANKGDRIVVKVLNNLIDPTAIHWHGIFQTMTNWYDGAAGITQCPIPNGISFVYNFSTGKQSGTFWWYVCSTFDYFGSAVVPF